MKLNVAWNKCFFYLFWPIMSSEVGNKSKQSVFRHSWYRKAVNSFIKLYVSNHNFQCDDKLIVKTADFTVQVQTLHAVTYCTLVYHLKIKVYTWSALAEMPRSFHLKWKQTSSLRSDLCAFSSSVKKWSTLERSRKGTLKLYFGQAKAIVAMCTA